MIPTLMSAAKSWPINRNWTSMDLPFVVVGSRCRAACDGDRQVQTDCCHRAIRNARSIPDIDFDTFTVGNMAMNSRGSGPAPGHERILATGSYGAGRLAPDGMMENDSLPAACLAARLFAALVVLSSHGRLKASHRLAKSPSWMLECAGDFIAGRKHVTEGDQGAFDRTAG